MNNGWIKLHRQFTSWEWYSDINVKVLFLHCLLSANHEVKKWRGIEIQKGQFITSLEHLSINTGLTVKQIRTALNKLKMTGEVACKTTSQYSIISINNWDKFQAEGKQEDKQKTNEGQAEGKQRATNKNIKNIKNIKNEKNIINREIKKIDPYTSKEVNEFIKKYQEYNTSCRILNQTRLKIAEAIEINGLDALFEVIEKSAGKGHFINNEFIPLSINNMLENAQKILDDSYNLVDRQQNGVINENTSDDDIYNMIYGDL